MSTTMMIRYLRKTASRLPGQVAIQPRAVAERMIALGNAVKVDPEDPSASDLDVTTTMK